MNAMTIWKEFRSGINANVNGLEFFIVMEFLGALRFSSEMEARGDNKFGQPGKEAAGEARRVRCVGCPVHFHSVTVCYAKTRAGLRMRSSIA